MAHVDIDDATGVSTHDADKVEQSTRNTISMLIGAAALLYSRNQMAQPEAPVNAAPSDPLQIEVLLDIQDLGHPRPLSGGYDDLPPYEAHELPPSGGTTPPDETQHTAYRPDNAPVAIHLRVGDDRLETDSEQMANDIQQLDNLDVVQRAIDHQPLPTDPDIEIQVGGDRVFYQGSEGRYVHPDFDLDAARELVAPDQRGEQERDDGAVIDIDTSPLHAKVGRVDREVPDANPEASQEQSNPGDSTPYPHADRAPTQERSHRSAPEQSVDTTPLPPLPPPVDNSHEQEPLTTATVPLSQAEAIAGQNEGDVSTDDAAIWMAQPTIPTVTRDAQGGIISSSSMEGLEATVDLVERKEDQVQWIQERLQVQQSHATMFQEAGQTQLATLFDQCLEVCYGKEGSATIIGNRYDISRDGHGGLTVTAKDGRGTIFERDAQSGDLTSAATAQDLQKFAAGAAILQQQQAGARSLPTPISRPQSLGITTRRSDIELG